MTETVVFAGLLTINPSLAPFSLQAKMSAPVFGFLGCGTLASALVEGLAKLPPSERPCSTPLYVTTRSAQKSLQLCSKYPNDVHRAENGSVWRRSDVVFLTVLPDQLETVMGDIRRKQQEEEKELVQPKLIISCISSLSRAQVASICGLDSTENVVKAIPLPASKHHLGTTVLVPPHTQVSQYFETLGSVHSFQHEQQIVPLQVMSCMGPLFETLRVCKDWCASNGTDVTESSRYIASMFRGLAHEVDEVKDDPRGFDALVASMTPGGFNARLVSELHQAGAFRAYDAGLSGLLDSLQKK